MGGIGVKIDQRNTELLIDNIAAGEKWELNWFVWTFPSQSDNSE